MRRRPLRATTDALHIPKPPTTLTATANGSSRIDLRWTAPQYDGGRHDFRLPDRNPQMSSSAWGVLVANTGSSATEYAHTGTEPGHRPALPGVGDQLGPATEKHRTRARATTDAVGSRPAATAEGHGRRNFEDRGAVERAGVRWRRPPSPGTGSRCPTTEGFAWEELAGDTRSTARVFFHEGLRPATTRHYRVVRHQPERAGGSPRPSPKRPPPPTCPNAPGQLVASARDHAQIDLGWDAPAFDGGTRITGYRIEMSEDAGASWTALTVNTQSTNTYYVHGGLLPASTRYYRVLAVNEVGLGRPSNVASATTDAIAPDPPTNLVATATTPTSIELNWDAPGYDGGAPVTGYRIEVSGDGTSVGRHPSARPARPTRPYAHTGLRPGSTRHYRVSAINVAGPGTPSGIAERHHRRPC